MTFGNVIIGQTGTLAISLQNPTICCYEYAITTSCPETVITPDLSNLLCTGGKQSIVADFTPTIVGNINCEVFVSVGCQTLSIPVTGTGKNPPEPSSGTSNGQKNKVDQTTPVQACSPRTANNRCQTAKTMQSAIKANAKRFGKR